MAEEQGKEYYTQTELAELFRVSAGTVKNWREKGYLPYLQMPGSTRVLYPCEAIEKVRAQFTHSGKEAEEKRAKRTRKHEMKREKPGMSSRPGKEWRI